MKLTLIVAVIGLSLGCAFALRAQAPKSQWSGVYTVEQADRGADVYYEQCALCHGGTLDGYALEDMEAPELVGPDFAEFWGDYTLGDLYEKMEAFMPQDDPGSLPSQKYADVLAFILQSGKYPAGSVELPPDAETLKTIRFLESKPEGD